MSKRPRARQRRKTREAKRRWPPAAFELPGSIEEIEAGIDEETQRQRDAQTVLLPCAGRLVPLEVPRRPQGEAEQ